MGWAWTLALDPWPDLSLLSFDSPFGAQAVLVEGTIIVRPSFFLQTPVFPPAMNSRWWELSVRELAPRRMAFPLQSDSGPWTSQQSPDTPAFTSYSTPFQFV